MRIVIEIGDTPVPAQSMDKPRIDQLEGVEQVLRDLATVGVWEGGHCTRIVIEMAGQGCQSRDEVQKKPLRIEFPRLHSRHFRVMMQIAVSLDA